MSKRKVQKKTNKTAGTDSQANKRISKSKPSSEKKMAIKNKSSLAKKASAKDKPPTQKAIPAKKKTGNKKFNLAAQLLYGEKEPDFSLINKRTNAYERIIEPDEMDSEFQLRHDELAQQYRQAVDAMAKIRKWIEQNYFGSGVRCTVALRKKNGRIVSPLRYVIEVHVPAKISDRNLIPWPAKNQPTKKLLAGKIFRVPSVVDGVLTKVVETVVYKTTSFSSGTELSGLVRKKADGKLYDISETPSIGLSTTQLIGGIPTAYEANQNNWGTFGIAFTSKVGSEVITYGLVNSHFADTRMVQPPFKPQPSDIPIWDIGVIPAGKKFDGNVTGERPEERFYVDAAMIELNDNRSVVLDLVQDFADEGFLYAQDYLRHFHDTSSRTDVNRKVFKFGARTSSIKNERIEGRIENPEDTSASPGSVIMSRSKGGVAFTLPGDSGSALVAPIFDEETCRERFLVVGLCFGGIEGVKDVLYACQFAAVIKALKLKIPKDLLRKDWSYGGT